MSRNPKENQTPDLFSTVTGQSPDEAPTATTERPSRRPAPPKNLPKAIRYLSDRELGWLLQTAMEEAKLRGSLVPMGIERPTNMSTVSPEPAPKQSKPPGRPARQRQTYLAPTLAA
jgi:hypothetical protein